MTKQYLGDIDKDTIKVIKNIRFTDREIDIIACLIGGRAYKKIASILSISFKTVDHHVRNIALKIGCNSREGIIDFIEKSDKFAAIKAHYVNILVRTAFEQELKKILSISKESSLNCLLFHDEKQITKASFIFQLERHLNIAGIKTFSKVWVKGKSKGFIINKIGTKKVDCIIYVLSHTFMEQLKTPGYDIHQEAIGLIPLVKESPFPIIFLLLENKTYLDDNKNRPNFAYISLLEPKNYYSLFFELIQKILPNHIIDKNVAKFKKQYEIFQGDPTLQKLSENSDLILESKDSNYKQKNKRNILKWLTLFFICLIGFSFAVFKINNKGNGFFVSKSQNIEAKVNNKQKTIIFNLPPRNNKFTGRDNILLKIEKQLNKKKLGVITQAIAGLGGIGKTHLAKEYAYQAAEKKEYPVIFWIPAETNNSINHAYMGLAKLLQVNVRGFGYNEVQSLVHQELAKKHKNSKVLFILDNVSDYENIRNYVQELNKELLTNLTLHILITSRNQHWPEKPLILDTFTPQEALGFAKKRLPNENKESLIKLIKTLHYYPLALNQATAYIRQHTNVDDYLALYSTKKKEYLNKFSGDKNQYKESLWKTWNIGLAKLSDAAKEMLFIASYLYPDDIPIDFFDNLSIEKRGEAIKDLRKHSFIILTNNNRSFEIHRLLQDVIRTTLNLSTKNNIAKKKYRILTKTIDLLKSKFNFDYLGHDLLDLCNKYLTHAQSLVNHTVNVKNKYLRTEGMKLHAQASMYIMYIKGERKVEQTMWKNMLTLVKQHYKKDKSLMLLIANISTHLSLAARTLDDTEQAMKYAKKAISIYESKIFNADISSDAEELLPYLRLDRKQKLHDGVKCDYSLALYCLGHLKKDLADFAAAENYFKKAIEILDMKFTPIYKIGILEALSNLYIRSGNIKNAKSILKSAKIIADKEFLGNLGQAFIYRGIANLLYYLGMYDEAKKSIEKSLQIRRSRFSKDSHKVGDALFLLGPILCANNHANEGIAYLKETEIIYDKSYKKDHRLYVFLYIYIGNALELNKEYNKALYYFTKAQKLAIKHWKEKSRIALAHLLSPIEKFPTLKASDKNISYYTKALGIIQNLFGENHIRASRYHYLLGQVFENSWNKAKAKKHYQKALDIANKQHFDNETLITGHQKNVAAIQNRLKKL